ncbi:hypothetical protein [Pseudonocardia sp.]|uniref:hypothetical protein n=1 Tax=Pseudonocardia sp. TaxID=60912 RepID=UPI002605D513|nr:hypothetical protein [Pseudonocardia sp.]
MTSARPRARWALHPATTAVVLLGLGAAGAVLDGPWAVAVAALAAGAAAGFANSGST